MTHVRGLHESGGIEALHVVRSKAVPGKLTTRLARLDHQRALLERQLAVWTEKQKTTRHRLNLVEKQMAEIGRAVRQFVTPNRAVSGRKRLGAIAAGMQPNVRVAAPKDNEMGLEY